MTHRVSVGVLAVLRLGIVLVLASVGISFLVMETDYIDLLPNGVALVFILETSQIIYALTLRDEIKQPNKCRQFKSNRIELNGSSYDIHGCQYNSRHDSLTIQNSIWGVGLLGVSCPWGARLLQEWEKPIVRVVNLLKDMASELEKEAITDAELYDKLACWCETNDKDKTKAIADANDAIALAWETQIASLIEEAASVTKALGEGKSQAGVSRGESEAASAPSRRCPNGPTRPKMRSRTC